MAGLRRRNRKMFLRMNSKRNKVAFPATYSIRRAWAKKRY